MQGACPQDLKDIEWVLIVCQEPLGYEKRPGPAQYDGIGKMIDVPPQPPEHIARQVDAINREVARANPRARAT